MRPPSDPAAHASHHDPHTDKPRDARPRDTDRLIRSWHRLRSASETPDDSNERGYDSRYDQPDITHERATHEAAAALAMARKYR
jgi:hypothetical protein